MKTHIDAYIDKMHKCLHMDIIEYIVKRHIFLPDNLRIIKKQKKIKYLIHLQLLFVSNILHIDDNYCIYIHNNNIIIYNIQYQSSNTYHSTLYGPSQNDLGTYDATSNIIIHTNHQDMENIIFYVVYSGE
jgi:hypothetical protein